MAMNSSDSEEEEAYPKPPDMESKEGRLNSDNQNLPQRRRLHSEFDYIGSENEAELFEDQFKQAAYQDETDMEDAFATDDGSKRISTEPSDFELELAQPPLEREFSHEFNNAVDSDAGSTPEHPSSPSKPADHESDRSSPNATPKKGKKGKKKAKELVPMAPLVEGDEPQAEPESPKTSWGILKKPSILQRLLGISPKPKKLNERNTEHPPMATPATEPEPLQDLISKSPRNFAHPSHAKEDYEPMRLELKSYITMERAFKQDLTVLVEEYLRPASLPPTLDVVAALLPPVEQLISAHGNALKSVEKSK